jgi:hypothetical protein
LASIRSLKRIRFSRKVRLRVVLFSPSCCLRLVWEKLILSLSLLQSNKLSKSKKRKRN